MIMPFIESGDLRLNYRLDGPQRPVIVLSNSLGTNLSMWDPQATVLCEKFCVLRYDTRGHGLSSATPGPYSIEQLGRDVITLLDALKVESAYFCGLSMGGMIGMWLGVNAASRMKGLVLCSTAAKIGTADTWNARIKEVKERGMAAIATTVVLRWFSEDFVKKSPEVIEAMRQMLLQAPPEGYAACCAAIRDADLSRDLSRVTARTLVIAGAQDPVISTANAHLVAEGIPGASYLELQAAHLSNIEAAPQFTEALLKFLNEPEAE
jgi:3-oxoadipate enol-lactonase